MSDFNKTVENFEVTEKALHIDPLDMAEKITGKDYHDDEDTGKLGLGFHLMVNAQKKELLAAQDDVHYGTSVSDYLRIMNDLGFEIILEETIPARHNPNELEIHEKYYIAWHPTKFILATFETYNVKELNSSKWHFAFKPTTVEDFYKNSFHFSGHFYGAREDLPRTEWIWIGNWDSREAIRHEMAKCDALGTFVKWPEADYLQLNTYTDWNQCQIKDHVHDWSLADKQTKRRFDLLPEHVKSIIKGIRPETVPLKDVYKNN